MVYEWQSTSKPLINHDSQRVLITSWTWLPTTLLGSHICWCAYLCLQAHQGTLFEYLGNTKVTEQEGTIGSQQDIFWLDIAMNHTMIMGILQSRSQLADIAIENIK